MNNKQKRAIYISIILLTIIILFPPYIITNKNHIPIETGYSFLFSLFEIKKGYFAANVNTELLLIQISVFLIGSGLLLFTLFYKQNDIKVEETNTLENESLRLFDFMIQNLSKEDGGVLIRALGEVGKSDIPSHMKDLYDRLDRVIMSNLKELIRLKTLKEGTTIQDSFMYYYTQYLMSTNTSFLATSRPKNISNIANQSNLPLDKKVLKGLEEDCIFIIVNAMLEQKKAIETKKES